MNYPFYRASFCEMINLIKIKRVLEIIHESLFFLKKRKKAKATTSYASLVTGFLFSVLSEPNVASTDHRRRHSDDAKP